MKLGHITNDSTVNSLPLPIVRVGHADQPRSRDICNFSFGIGIDDLWDAVFEIRYIDHG